VRNRQPERAPVTTYQQAYLHTLNGWLSQIERDYKQERRYLRTISSRLIVAQKEGREGDVLRWITGSSRNASVINDFAIISSALHDFQRFGIPSFDTRLNSVGTVSAGEFVEDGIQLASDSWAKLQMPLFPLSWSKIPRLSRETLKKQLRDWNQFSVVLSELVHFSAEYMDLSSPPSERQFQIHFNPRPNSEAIDIEIQLWNIGVMPEKLPVNHPLLQLSGDLARNSMLSSLWVRRHEMGSTWRLSIPFSATTPDDVKRYISEGFASPEWGTP
jgi:hypothetical protein